MSQKIMHNNMHVYYISYASWLCEKKIDEKFYKMKKEKENNDEK